MDPDLCQAHAYVHSFHLEKYCVWRRGLVSREGELPNCGCVESPDPNLDYTQLRENRPPWMDKKK